MDKRFGLKTNCIADIVNVLKLQSEVEEALIFGSRAMGTYKNGSDIDIALKGDQITFDTMSTIRLRLDELPYLYTYDVIDYKKISNLALTAHIDELGITFYKKEKSPNEWKTYKLGELIEINKNSINKNYSFDEIEYLDTSSVTENRFSELQKLKLSDAPSRAKRIVKENDIVYSTVRPILRHYGIAKNIKSNTIASTGFAVLTARNIAPDFLYYYLTTDEIVYFLNSVAEANTTTYPAFNSSLFENIEVTIPKSLETQTQIAQILTSLDDKIELNLQMNQTLEAMAQALFKEWFVNFNFPSSESGFTELNDLQDLNNKSSKSKNTENQGSDNLPQGWRMGKLNDISTNFDNKRIPLSSMQRKDRKGIYPYYGAATIFDYIDDYIFDGTYLLMGEDGTVQTTEGLPVLQYVWGKFWVNNHTHVLQGKSPFSTEYLYLLLSKTNITYLITGAVQPKINQGNMNKIECVLPTEQVLNDFQTVINPIFEKIKYNSLQIQTLTQTRDTLLPKLMSGKIRLNQDFQDSKINRI